jgi:ammonium transporter Rh
LLSVFGFSKIQPWLLAKHKIHDTCGINNLHGMPSLIGGVASMIVAGYKNSGGRSSDSAIYGPDAEYQWFWQFCGILATLFISITSGLLTGYLVNAMDIPIVSTAAEYEDQALWESVAETRDDDKDN